MDSQLSVARMQVRQAELERAAALTRNGEGARSASFRTARFVRTLGSTRFTRRRERVLAPAPIVATETPGAATP